jgi:hypothetical protein
MLLAPSLLRPKIVNHIAISKDKGVYDESVGSVGSGRLLAFLLSRVSRGGVHLQAWLTSRSAPSGPWDDANTSSKTLARSELDLLQFATSGAAARRVRPPRDLGRKAHLFA